MHEAKEVLIGSRINRNKREIKWINLCLFN